MSDSSVKHLTNAFSKTAVEAKGVSFKGKSLKLNEESDCKEVVEAIEACKNLEYLNLEGNTLGVEASKAISKALESKSELKRALWKDMFTGRMKEEIPRALENLGNGLTIAKAQLTELDLSDNAFGPIGVSGLANLLSSPSCYQLQELKLNNNGLGISGGKMLAEALLRCHKNSTKKGKSFALKLLVIGRNRLENEGATALAEVFNTLGTLEEISMPQNGIYHQGIEALSNSFKNNHNLKVLDLNDNTVTKVGANHIAAALPHLQKLKILNLGDCLLGTDGATILAKALTEKHDNLEELHLGFNEIKLQGGLAVAKAVANKSKLKKLDVNGNHFGSDGRTLLKEDLKKQKRLSALEPLSEDCSSDESDSEHNSKDDDKETEGDEANGLSYLLEEVPKNSNELSSVGTKSELAALEADNLSCFLNDLSFKAKAEGPLKTFLENPTGENLLKVKEININEFINKNQDYSIDFYVDTFIPLLVKISSLSGDSNEEVKKFSSKISQNLYQNLFKWALKKSEIAAVNNALFVYLGLIKSEEKNFKINWNLKGSLAALHKAIYEGAVPLVTQDTLKLLMEKESKKHTNEEIVVT